MKISNKNGIDKYIKSLCVTSGSPTKYKNILDPILNVDASSEDKKYYNAVWLHAFQSIKRKMIGLEPRQCHIPCLFGRQELTGKSDFVGKFEALFNTPEISLTTDVFWFMTRNKVDQACVFRKYFVTCDNMFKHTKTKSEILNQMIEDPEIVYKWRRHTYVQKNLTTFFATTNYTLREIFGDTKTSRHFVEIPVINSRFPREYVNNIDALDFWKSIDSEYEYLAVDETSSDEPTIAREKVYHD